MSFLIATPDLVESAAADLAGIHTSLTEAAASAAVPTMGIASAAQDEVSVAVASMFGSVGHEFQALSAQAQSFHAQFVETMNAGAGAYAAAETLNAGQTLGGPLGGGGAALGQFAGSATAGLNGALTTLQADVGAASAAIVGAPTALSGAIQTGAQGVARAVTGFETQFGALATGGVPGLVSSFNAFATQVATPYQELVINTVNNLQGIGNTFMANPFPFLNQLANNQIGYAQTIATAIATGIQNLPAELANLPATIQAAVQAFLAFNPVPYLQGFINNSIGYAQTIATGLLGAARDLGTGLLGLPSAFQAAGQQLLAGNIQGAVNTIGQGIENVFLPGFEDVNIPLSQFGFPGEFPVIPLGPLGDLLPIFAIPGEIAQNLTNLLPAGSIPAQMAQNFTNVLTAVTDFNSSLNSQNFGITFGLPLQLVFDGIGAPINALSALNSSAVAFGSALQTGNVAGAVAAVLDAPAVVANGFLNGQTLLALPPLTVNVVSHGVNVLTVTSTASLPLGGLLTPLSPVIDSELGPLPGTEIGGIIPGLLSFRSQLAAAITPTT